MNLNSLYGEWQIDFSTPEYTTNGIFALTGPTGAGKSTVLDAICLALYGTTPRLGKITKKSNDIMSRQTGECFAEVIFQSQKGSFRAYWYQHRARKKPDGELQNPRHEISEDGENSKVLEHHLRRVATFVEKVTGMDFERFTRSILLAQGGFDTFLKADIEQKSRILEQITGTEIYSNISKRVHERQRQERERFETLSAHIAGINILDEEEQTLTVEALNQAIRQEKELRNAITRLEEAIAWRKTIIQTQKNISDLEKEADLLAEETTAFKPQRQRLKLAETAAEFAAEYAALEELRKQQKSDKEALSSHKKTLPALLSTMQSQEKELAEVSRALDKAKRDQQEAAPIIRETRALDQEIERQREEISRLQDEYDTASKKIAEKDHQLQKLNKNTRQQHDKQKELELYLQEHACDERLVSEFTGIKRQVSALIIQQEDLERLRVTIKDKEKESSTAQNNLAKAKTILNERQDILKEKAAAIDREKAALHNLLGGLLLREYRQKKDTLLRERAFLAQIAKLEEQRKKLEEGAPCPLCGATKHPFVSGHPQEDEVDGEIARLEQLISRAEGHEEAIKLHEGDEKKALMAVTEAERSVDKANNNLSNLKSRLQELGEEVNNRTKQYDSEKNTILKVLSPYFTRDISTVVFSTLLQDLEKRLDSWRKRATEKQNLERRLNEDKNMISVLSATLNTLKEHLAGHKETIKEAARKHTLQQAKRQEIFSSKSPDREEERLADAIRALEKAEKGLRNKCDASRQKVGALQTTMENLGERVKQRKSAIESTEDIFAHHLKEANLTSEKQFLAATLPIQERHALQERWQNLKEKETDLKARQRAAAATLSAELKRALNPSPLEALLTNHNEQAENLSEIQEKIAALRHTLKIDEEAKKRLRDKQDEIKAQKKEYERWDKLHSLIGSMDGKKYRNFAQGLTFELMVSHANQQLQKMSDRYILIRDDRSPLSLNVVDNFQAGEIRPTKNLSGGESFIVSLNLALGLSKMASRQVRVDSLFLDEGFGTLDEEALETALDTLATLKEEGKLIGIISHVAALKERIGAQINIQPTSGGKSVIMGPGCTQASVS